MINHQKKLNLLVTPNVNDCITVLKLTKKLISFQNGGNFTYKCNLLFKSFVDSKVKKLKIFGYASGKIKNILFTIKTNFFYAVAIIKKKTLQTLFLWIYHSLLI